MTAQTVNARIPPHDLDSERAVLGCLLIEPEPSWPAVARLTFVDFFLEAHRVIYTHLCQLHDAGVPITVNALQDSLLEAGELSLVGGPIILATLSESGTVPGLLSRPVEIILRHSARRQAIQAMTTAIDDLYGSDDHAPAKPVLDVAVELGDMLSKLAERADTEQEGAPDEPLGDIAEQLLADLALSLPDFITYPLAGLMNILGGGSRRGELVYLAAGFGTGKTGIALEWAGFNAQRGKRVLVISAEMTKKAVAARILTQRAMIGANSFRTGDLTPEEWGRAHDAMPTLKALPIVIDDQANTLGQIRRLVRRHRPDLVIIDYLQLLQGPQTAEKRHEINAISRGLKRMAKRHDCVVLALSQITLVPDGKGKFQRPSAASLKESRGPSEDADTILLLWRPDPEKRDLELIVGKGRSHATGTVNLEFTSQYLWFREV
jgi:replicative DNA helicase